MICYNGGTADAKQTSLRQFLYRMFVEFFKMIQILAMATNPKVREPHFVRISTTK